MNSLSSLIRILHRMNEQGSFDGLTDELFARVVDGAATAWIRENAMGYTEAAAKLGITKGYLEKVISDYKIKTLHIRGIKQKLILRTEVKEIGRIVKKTYNESSCNP